MVARVRADALVDGLALSDKGCWLHPSCRTCPLPTCLHDAPNGVASVRADLRALIAQRRRSQGVSGADIGRELGVSIRCVWHLMKRPVPNLAMSRSQRVTVEGGGDGV